MGGGWGGGGTRARPPPPPPPRQTPNVLARGAVPPVGREASGEHTHGLVRDGEELLVCEHLPPVVDWVRHAVRGHGKELLDPLVLVLEFEGEELYDGIHSAVLERRH